MFAVATSKACAFLDKFPSDFSPWQFLALDFSLEARRAADPTSRQCKSLTPRFCLIPPRHWRASRIMLKPKFAARA